MQSAHLRAELGHPLSYRKTTSKLPFIAFVFYLDKASSPVDTWVDLSVYRVHVGPPSDCKHGAGVLRSEEYTFRVFQTI